MERESIDISICACTYKRPDGLRKLLISLLALNVPAGVRAEVLIVDNDANASAREIVAGIEPIAPIPIRYVVEAQSGVGHARNRCMREAAGEWVAFIDDDEWAESAWLSALLSTAQSQSADIVMGPVVPAFAEAATPGMLASAFFARPRYATGMRLDWRQCATGNVLLKRRLFQDVGGFSAAFAIGGGEDSEFFSRCGQRGAVMIWCDTALVHEEIPAERMTRHWLIKRSFVNGNNYARVCRARDGWLAYADAVLRGLVSIAVYGPATLFARVIRHSKALAFECKVAAGFGKIASLFSTPPNIFGGKDEGS